MLLATSVLRGRNLRELFRLRHQRQAQDLIVSRLQYLARAHSHDDGKLEDQHINLLILVKK